MGIEHELAAALEEIAAALPKDPFALSDAMAIARQALSRYHTAKARGSPWQPIETAPKDGSEVLVWRDDTGILLARYTSCAEFLPDAELEHMDEVSAIQEDWFAADFLSGGRLESDCAPTHWMPLPPAPDTL